MLKCENEVLTFKVIDLIRFQVTWTKLNFDNLWIILWIEDIGSQVCLQIVQSQLKHFKRTFVYRQ